jgi:hypothetical protein
MTSETIVVRQLFYATYFLPQNHLVFIRIVGESHFHRYLVSLLVGVSKSLGAAGTAIK